MKFLADLHIHSKYSRATSKDMDIEHLAEWAKIKGIDLIGTGDFTHPLWLEELKRKLTIGTDGLYEYKGIKFILTAEVSNMYSKYRSGRRIHTILIAPDFKTVDKINRSLSAKGNLQSDGRPIFGFDVKDIVKICIDASKDCLIVPSHIWTPWFGIFGSRSGFNSIEECFEEESGNIYALETGLSSDPAMNWRWSSLDKYTLISNSDAHSPSKLGREVNVFDTELSYKGFAEALKQKDRNKFLFTVEFFPEEGKYHFDGHRDCGIRLAPEETNRYNKICPKCKKSLTVGVMNRIVELADREEGFIPDNAIPYKSLVPLIEIISEARQKGVNTKIVLEEYYKIVNYFGNEFNVLLNADEDELSPSVSERVVEAIKRVRAGKLYITPGYDGVFGTVKIFSDEEKTESKSKQLELFL